jgi:two-component system cell cycle response regulator
VAPTRPRILVVDDSPTQLDWLVQVLLRDGYDVVSAATGREAVVKARTLAPDLVLLDMILPDMDGLEVLRLVKARPDERFLPVIILSVKSDVDTKVEGLRIGADDFIAKPFAEAEILARCAAMLRIKLLQDQLRATRRSLEEQSVTDGLTGLKNRRFFDERLPEEFRRAQRYSDPVSLMMIDLDHFKEVNDRYGHQMGDVVLRDAAAAIKTSVRDPDICSRYGGEEFAVILPKTHLGGALTVAERVWRGLRDQVYRQEVPAVGQATVAEVRVTASVGLAIFPSRDIVTAELLVKFADEALYQAKRSGRNNICLYQAQK